MTFSENALRHDIYLRLAHNYACGVTDCADSSRDGLIFAEKLLDDTVRRFRRVFGVSHPGTVRADRDLVRLRRRLAAL